METILVLSQNVSPVLAKHVCFGNYVVGVDAGALYCLRNGIKMHEAIGDFDSISYSAYLELVASNVKMIKLPVEKDVTDTEFALQQFKGEVLILGGLLGKRFEHGLANALLLKRYPKAVILDDYSKVFYIKAPREIEVAKEEYRFLSVFPLGEIEIVGEGLQYPYPKKMEAYSSLGVSNEFKGDKAKLKLTSGEALVVLTKDDAVEF